MPSGFHNWSQTAATNASADSAINWAEGQPPSSVNDSSRAMMAVLAKHRDDTAGTLTTAGTDTAYTLATNTVFTSLALLSGQKLKVRFDAANGASPTLNVDGLGAKAIQVKSGTAVGTGVIGADSVWDVTYDNSIPAFLLSGVPVVVQDGTVATASIANDAVTYAKMQNVSATSRVLGRATSGAGDVEELTVGTGLALTGTTLSAPATPVQSAFKNLSIKVASNTTVTVAADYVTMFDGTNYRTAAVSGTCDLGTNGAVNALDAGSIAAATWYYVWAISNGSIDGTLASTSSTAPTMPSGYTFKARIGAVRTAAGSAQLLGSWQFGRRAQYVVGLAQCSALPNIANGTAGTASNTAPTYATASVTAVVPTTAAEIFVVMTPSYNNGTFSTMAVAPNTSYSGFASTNPPWAAWGGGAAINNGAFSPPPMLLEGSTIAWYSSAAGGGLFCGGWIDNI